MSLAYPGEGRGGGEWEVGSMCFLALLRCHVRLTVAVWRHGSVRASGLHQTSLFVRWAKDHSVVAADCGGAVVDHCNVDLYSIMIILD